MWRLGVLALLAGCTAPDTSGDPSGDGVDDPSSGDGIVFKGPMVRGSTVRVTPLDDALEPAGAPVDAEVSSDGGRFSVELPVSGLVRLEALGTAFDEARCGLGPSPMALSGYGVLRPDRAALQLNLLTDLSRERVAALVADGLGFDEASAQAEQELLDALGFGRMSDGARGADMVIYGAGDDAARLLVLSSIVSQVGVLLEADGAGDRASFMDELRIALADTGGSTPAQRELLRRAVETFDPAMIGIGVRAFVRAADGALAFPEVGAILDTDGDGRVNDLDVCPFVADPDQRDSEARGWGDACDARASRVAFGGGYGCVIGAADGRLTCWEDAHAPQGGLPPRPDSFPAALVGPWGDGAGLDGVYTDVALAEGVACAVAASGVDCWTPAGLFTLSGAVERVVVSNARVCTLDAGGAVACYDHAGVKRSQPRGTFADVAPFGATGVCAVTLRDGALACFDGAGGALTELPALAAAAIDGSRQGSGWGCAVRADDGRVECFGDGAVTPGLGRFVDVAVGDGLACAARDDGPTVCWRDAAICPVTGAPDPLPPAMDGLAVDACAVCGVDADGLADCWPRWWYRRPTP